MICIPVASELHPGIHICAILGPHWLGITVIPLMAYDLLLFVLALNAYARHVKELNAQGVGDRETLLALLLRDNIWYFLLYVILRNCDQFLPNSPDNLASAATLYILCGVSLLVFPVSCSIALLFSLQSTS
jgi:hypothetical protein